MGPVVYSGAHCGTHFVGPHGAHDGATYDLMGPTSADPTCRVAWSRIAQIDLDRRRRMRLLGLGPGFIL